MKARHVYRFGAFTLDLGERRLSAGNVTIRLSPKAFDVLAALVQHQGRLLTKDELLARVWPESFVEDGILTVHVSALRKALGDETRPPSYIETVPRSGYRFIAAVMRESHDESSPPRDAARPVELYEFVGRGRVHLLSGSFLELPVGIEAFRAAIALDPTYAPGHAGLARARCAQAMLRAVPHQEAFTEAKALALRALAMDSASADAQVALGTFCFSASGTGRRASAACVARSTSTLIHDSPNACAPCRDPALTESLQRGAPLPIPFPSWLQHRIV